MIKIMVVGAGGQLGKQLSELARQTENIELFAYDRQALDICDSDAIENVISTVQPQCVVNAAAYTAVDKAESDVENAFLINETGAENLANTCAQADVPLIHISTDYVFNGKKDSPYNEEDATDPQNIYGQSKLKGEEAVRDVLNKHIILRVSWVFGLHGNNFVKSILRLAREREQLNIVADQLGCPTSTVNISQVILQMIPQICQPDFKKFGTYHYCDAPETTWFGFASAIVEQANTLLTNKPTQLAIKQIIPIMTHEYPTPAKRPVNSRMDTSLLTKTFGINQAQWRPELDKLMQELLLNEL